MGNTNIIYVRFIHAEDVYFVYPSFGLRPVGEPDIPIVCSRCGGTLYIAIQMPEGADIVQPQADIFRPFPHEKPDWVIRCKPEQTITLTWALPKLDYWASHDRKNRFKRNVSMVDVGDDYATMIIKAVSRTPVEHICGQ